MSNSSNIRSYERGNSITKNIQALISLIGIILNITAICVFERKRLKKCSYSIYWKAIAFVDSFLLLHTFRHFSKHFLNFDIDLISPLFCRFNEYQPYVAAIISLCFETVITIDRYFTIIHPNRFASTKKRPFQIVVISVIVVYSLLVCINLPLGYRLYKLESGVWKCDAPINSLKIHSIIILSNVLFVNLVVNPILDLKIVCHIVSTRPTLRNVRFKLIDRKFAFSAILLNVNSLVLKLLFVISNLVSIYFNLGIDDAELVFSICLSVALIEKADVFIVNVLVNSIFRKEFLSMIGFNRFETPTFV